MRRSHSFQRRCRAPGWTRGWGGLALCHLACAVSLLADDQDGWPAGRPDQPPRRVLRPEITSDLQLAIERGFDFLIRNQKPSGSFDTDDFPVANNALAGLAFLAGGHSTQSGPYAEALQRVLDHLLAKQKEDGYFEDSDNASRMYGHGFATLFLAQLYGMTGQKDKKVRFALKRAVRLIESSQCADGGWDYNPVPRATLFSRRGASDTSITVCQTMALRAARNLGVWVDPRVVASAKAFVQKAQNSDGGFAYRLGEFPMNMQRSEFPRSAAGVCVLLSLGEYDSLGIAKGFEYLRRHYRNYNDFPFYADYYCAQAMFQAGRHYWSEYFRYIKEKLIRKQKPEGSWSGDMGGTIQSTAMALIVLQIPYRFLPVTER
ncbi:MAG: terpene cyclase/mutase family protein [Planctomycetes bacterium]|nr:terpene cyclase/mutase family protein [Planctomycetota bacterium]